MVGNRPASALADLPEPRKRENLVEVHVMYRTREAEHGTQYHYRVRYTDEGDVGCPIFSTFIWAYSREDAEEKFRADGDDWKIIKIERIIE